MIRVMRTVNGVLVVLWILGGTMSVVQSLGNWGTTVGALFGIALWSAPFYLAWRGLGPNGTLASVEKARWANIAYLALMALVFVAFGAFTDKASSLASYLPLILALLIFGIPSVLNIKVLRKREAELDQTTPVPATDHLEAHASPGVALGVASTAVPLLASAPQSSSTYFLRHWRGDLPLATSYWVNGTLIATVLPFIVIAVLSDYVKQGESLRFIALNYVLSVIIALALWLWSIVGIWRSSNNHVARGGLRIWANLAKVAVVLGMIGMTGQLANTYVPMLKDMTLIVLGEDPMGSYKATVLSDGKSILIKGILREGSAKEIEKLIDSVPAVKTLVLSSNGGRLLEGRLLATAISKRALNTYVEDICISTCTFVFLAGKERAATPNAKIGFHTPSFPGADPEILRAGVQFMTDVYRRVGLPKQFIERVRNIPSAEMWYPTRDELIDAGVITRISLGGETTTAFTQIPSQKELLLLLRSVPLWQSIETRFPDFVLRAVERGWKVREQGGNDNQISTAMRSVIAELVPVLLRETSTKSIETYVTLMVDQMRTARAVSYEACHQLLNGQLNPLAVFPKDLRDREERWMLEALSSQPMPNRQFSKRAAEQALAVASSKIPSAYLDVTANPANYQQRPDLVCDSMIAVYEAVLSLPSAQRGAALEGMFKEGA